MNQISGLVGRPRSTVYGIVNWFGKTKTVLNKPLSGRPQKLTNSDNRFIVREIKKDQKTSAPKVTTDREKSDVYAYVGRPECVEAKRLPRPSSKEDAVYQRGQSQEASRFRSGTSI